MANETIGRVLCPRHDDSKEHWGEVRKNKHGRLYYMCEGAMGCGLVRDTGQNFQEWMLARVEIFPADHVPPPIAAPVVQLPTEVTIMPTEKEPAAPPIKKTTVTVRRKKVIAAPVNLPPAESQARKKTDVHHGVEGDQTESSDWLL